MTARPPLCPAQTHFAGLPLLCEKPEGHRSRRHRVILVFADMEITVRWPPKREGR